MLGQNPLPNENTALPLQVQIDRAPVYQDVASGRRNRFLWTALGCAVLALLGVSAWALHPLAPHVSAEPSLHPLEAAFVPISGLGLRGILPGKRDGSDRARPTALLSASSSANPTPALPGSRPARFPVVQQLVSSSAAHCRTSTAVFCICIDCKLVDRCKVYHWVEQNHNVPHITEKSKLDFDPNDPQIQVFVRQNQKVLNRVELRRHTTPAKKTIPPPGGFTAPTLGLDGRPMSTVSQALLERNSNKADVEVKAKADAVAKTSAAAPAEATGDEADEFERFEFGSLTTEYDVFGCDAFQPDKGKWMRLMPDAEFVPT